MKKWMLWGLCLALAPVAAVGAETGAELVEKVQNNFAKYKTFAADFEQEFHWVVLDRKLKKTGRIYTRRPGAFRLEVDGGDLFVADGKTIWSYSPQNEQVVASAYDGDFRTPWEVLVDYTEAFDPVAVEEVKLDRRKCYMLTLRPQANVSEIVQLRVWVDRDKWHLLRLEKLEADDNTTVYTLSNHRINKKIDDGLFTFEVPSGVELIDRRIPDEAKR